MDQLKSSHMKLTEHMKLIELTFLSTHLTLNTLKDDKNAQTSIVFCKTMYLNEKKIYEEANKWVTLCNLGVWLFRVQKSTFYFLHYRNMMYSTLCFNENSQKTMWVSLQRKILCSWNIFYYFSNCGLHCPQTRQLALWFEGCSYVIILVYVIRSTTHSQTKITKLGPGLSPVERVF